MAYPSMQGNMHARQPSVATLSEQLELNLSLRNIPKMDLMSPSDPFVVVKMKDEIHNRWTVVGKTDIIWDNPNPDFSKDIRISYLFEEIQTVRLDIWDANEEQTKDLKKHDYIGYIDFVVGDLVTSKGQKLVVEILNAKGAKLKKVAGLPPIAIVRSQEVDENYDEIELEFSAKSLPKMDWFGKIDPFFQLYRQTNDGQWASVYKSEHYKSTYSPNWKRFKVETRRLCHGDMHRPILIKIWDWNRDAQPDYACEIQSTLSELIDVKQLHLKQWNPKKNKYKSKNKYGQIFIKYANIIKKYSFTSFLTGGLEIQLFVAIDFTGSNGDPRDTKSLHYMGAPHYESQYMKVIKSVGRVLEPYDADGAIAAYGFGANLNPYGKQVSHCFNLTLHPNEEEVDGIDGLIAAYQQCLSKVQLYGPTYFSEIITNAAAKSIGICDQKNQSYNILLIITDGVLNDMQRTADAIVDATSLPLSIIIVGVGDADFTNMDILDADDEPLRHSRTGKYMIRDIVQFVPFNEFKTKHMSAIAKETLEEVPAQVTSFMSMHNISPAAPQHAQGPSMDNIYSALSASNNAPQIQNVEMKEAHQVQNVAAYNVHNAEGGYTNIQQPGGGSAAIANAAAYQQPPPAYNVQSAPINPYYGGAALNNGNYGFAE